MPCSVIKSNVIQCSNTAGSYNSRVPLANEYKSEEIVFNSDTKHDLQVDSSNINTEEKQNSIKISTSYIWKNIMFQK